jgi:hypothetical protein
MIHIQTLNESSHLQLDKIPFPINLIISPMHLPGSIMTFKYIEEIIVSLITRTGGRQFTVL